MQLKLVPHKLALTMFALFVAAMTVAFWPSYFARLGNQATYHPHLHGLTMTLWCALLLAQATLIGAGARRWHRLIGRTSYVLVPLMVYATLDFLHFRLAGARTIGDAGLHFVALVVNALVAFLLLFLLAIRYRHNSALHARYMIATIFPLFTPITDRLVGAYRPDLAVLVPTIDGAPIVPVIGFLLADLILLALVLWDWLARRQVDAFAVALGITGLYHVSALTFHVVPAWREFAYWFQGLPL